MDTTEAKRLIRESLSIPNESCSAWSPPDRDRDEFLNERRSDLVDSLIEPFPVSVTPDVSAKTFRTWENRPYTMFVVAETVGDYLLLLNCENELFSLGSVDSVGIVRLLGYASKDALAEWVD